ncbi:hypothetical protein DMB66_25375, partial [Actinoplanes sp. ATCC 53533]|uniref:hypothetical protein n=1 Tax=Actinoplanes sp. ATCC 53533 TaxID=1288362 RepID=UPI0010049DF9
MGDSLGSGESLPSGADESGEGVADGPCGVGTGTVGVGTGGFAQHAVGRISGSPATGRPPGVARGDRDATTCGAAGAAAVVAGSTRT